MARSSSKRKSASALASSVLPTPVGPRNRKEPVGRSGSATPARERRTASATAATAALWPMRRSPMTRSIWSSLSCSPARSLPTGIPVQDSTTSAISTGPTFSAIIGSAAARSTPSGPTMLAAALSPASASRICFSRAGISP